MSEPAPYGDEVVGPDLSTPAGGWSSMSGDQAAEAVVRGRHRQGARTSRDLDEASEIDEYEARREEIKLRRRYGRGLLIVLVVQLALADVAYFVKGGPDDLRWYISGTVVEVVGLVWVVVKYLFSDSTAPRRRGD